MININLLPEVLRKKERMPLPQFLGLLAIIGVIGLMGYMITKYQFDTIPRMEAQRTSLQNTRSQLQAKEQELRQITGEIARLSVHVDAVKTLYKNRVVWAKILSDLKNIVNFDPTMSEYNADMRYLWLTGLQGKGKLLEMQGFATSGNQVVAMQMPERLLREILSFAPVTMPEADEEARLLAELEKVKADYDILRRDSPELPIQGEEEIRVRQRLEEIKSVKSGGIAMQSFSSLLVPASLKLLNATWTTAPAPRGNREQAMTEIFPTQAWQFRLSMNLK